MRKNVELRVRTALNSTSHEEAGLYVGGDVPNAGRLLLDLYLVSRYSDTDTSDGVLVDREGSLGSSP